MASESILYELVLNVEYHPVPRWHLSLQQGSPTIAWHNSSLAVFLAQLVSGATHNIHYSSKALGHTDSSVMFKYHDAWVIRERDRLVLINVNLFWIDQQYNIHQYLVFLHIPMHISVSVCVHAA